MDDDSSLEWLSRVAWLLEARDDEEDAIEEDAFNPDGIGGMSVYGNMS